MSKRPDRSLPRGTARTNAGFTLLEASVALAVFAIAGMALYGLFNTNLIALNRAEDVSRQSVVVRNAMDYLASVDPRIRPEGSVDLGGATVTWSAELVEPVRQGQFATGGMTDFDFGLYEVVFEIVRQERSLGTWQTRLVGYQKLRGQFPGETPF